MNETAQKTRNKVKPTQKQRKAFENIERGMSKRQAMLAAGYTEVTSSNSKQNLMESRGYQKLIEEYRGHLKNAGVSPDILAEIQAEGLFDQDARVRLEYLKENKKDFGLAPDEKGAGNTVNILVIPSELMTKYGITPNTETSSK